MPVTFSAATVYSRIARKIEVGINATANEAAQFARQKAPVRKVRRTAGGRGRPPLLAAPTVLRFNTPLTARGRFELKSGRAAFTSPTGSMTLGGRLRGEILAVPSESGGPTWVAKVVSPTPYAKYVEFGTRRSRAQPYLRPALSQVRESFRARMRSAARLGRVT